MNPSFLLEIIISLLLFLCAIVLHEYGHLIMLRNKYPKAKVNWSFPNISVGEDYMYKNSSKEFLKKIYYEGIIFGFIPLLFIIFVNGFLYLGFILIYVYGCKHDIKQLLKLEKV